MKSYIGICAWCGAEYDKRHIVDGKLVSVRPLYCCSEHRYKAKKAKEKERLNQKNAAAREARSQEKIVRRNRDDYKRWHIKPGPASWAHCFDCPFQGWACRSVDYPRCRREESYKSACENVFAVYGEDRWL